VTDDITRLTGHCPGCGRALPLDAPEGLCAACLFGVGAETMTRSSDDLPTMTAGALPVADEGGQWLQEDASWGPYKIGRLLGRGGMGEVYEAEHRDSGRRIALKVLRGQLRNAEDRARFLREGQLAASVSHPHTVYIFGSEEIGGMPVISMELLKGGTLKDRVVERGPFPIADAVSAVLDIAGGLDAAQAAGILHRDIKPSNCFVDADGTVKVGDFGLSISTLARDVRAELQDSGFQGTPQFAPPEQLRGDPLDVRADIYAVGATLYYLLTGRPPFDAKDLRELVAKVTNDTPVSPRQIRPEIPSALGTVVMKCLAKTPAERPSSYAALAEALRPFSAVAEAPASLWVRFVAGAADSAILGVPVGLLTMQVSDPLTQTAAGAAVISVWTWPIAFLYYFLFESRWGASPGKRLLGLRVTAADGTRARAAQIAARTAVVMLPSIALASAVLLFRSSAIVDAIARDPVLGTLRAIVTQSLVFALFLPARRRNAWAAVHDRVSGTRVIARALTHVSRVGDARSESADAAPAHSASGRRLGPFVVVAPLAATRDAELLIAFDPVLRRRVWIHAVAPRSPAVSAARRDVGRMTRLHWLTGRRSPDENWDAYEAPDGGALLTAGREAGWRLAKLWLLDLARELDIAAADATLPPLALDRLWVRADGRLLLLDFLARDQGSTESVSPSALITQLARHVLEASGPSPSSIPLSGRTLLSAWASSKAPDPGTAYRALTDVARVPDAVQRWRRTVPIGIGAAPVVLFVGVSLLVSLLLTRVVGGENGEMMRWLGILSAPVPPPQTGLADPAARAVAERYVAARYRDRLTDSRYWNSLLMQQPGFDALRHYAEALVERHPALSEAEIQQLRAQLPPQFNRPQLRRQEDGFLRGVSVIISTVTAMALGLVLACALVSSVLVPGGVAGRSLGLAVVDRRGVEIGRARSFARALIAWLPGILWFVYLASAPKIQRVVPSPESPLLAVTLTLTVLGIGAAWAITRPSRGLHDRLAGTWVVPR
jgi:uncharacterized RDD family membrane protein YckC